MFGIGVPELIVIFVIALLIFGPKKLPELGKALGRGIAEFKRASQEIKESIEIEARKEELKKYLDPSTEKVVPDPGIRDPVLNQACPGVRPGFMDNSGQGSGNSGQKEVKTVEGEKKESHAG